MDGSILETQLPRFVDQVKRLSNGLDRAVSVDDLRLGIRHERMLEISNWPNHVLDTIEVYASRFQGQTPLEQILNPPSDVIQSTDAASVSSICAPSPFAWT